MKPHESQIAKKAFRNSELRKYIDTHWWNTIAWVFSLDGKQYEIQPADEHDIEKRFKNFEYNLSETLSSAIENALKIKKSHLKVSFAKKIYALFQKSKKDIS